MFGSLDLGLGTEVVVGTLGAGGGMAGIFNPFMTGRDTGMELKS